MVIILNYVLLGIVLYVAIIPILEELATIIVQALENLKGKLLVTATKLQNEVTKLSEESTTPETTTHVIGFQVPDEQYYEEDYEEDDE